MERILLRKSNGFEKDLTYHIIHEHPNYNDRQTNMETEHSLVRPSEIKPIDGHILIEEYHSIGGGGGGWDSYADFVGMAHGKDNLLNKIYECALFAAKDLAKKQEVEFVDESTATLRGAGARGED